MNGSLIRGFNLERDVLKVLFTAQLKPNNLQRFLTDFNGDVVLDPVRECLNR